MPLAPHEIEERAADARALLNNPMFQRVVALLEAEAVDTLRGIPVGDLTAHAPHAKLVVLAEIKATLNSYVTDGKMLSRSKPN